MYINKFEKLYIFVLTLTVIISRGNEGDNFYDIYIKIDEDSKQYTGNKSIIKGEKVKIPDINLNVIAELKEIEQKPFLFADGRQYVISKALQTIKFSLDEKGGKIKSEAGMMVNKASAMEDVKQKRDFVVNDTFFIFLKEKDKTLPYFAAKISDISKVQSNITEDY